MGFLTEAETTAMSIDATHNLLAAHTLMQFHRGLATFKNILPVFRAQEQT